MDHDHRTTAAAQFDSERAAKIVRSVEQLDGDATLLIGPLSDRFMLAASQEIEKTAPSPWQMAESEVGARIVCPDWKMTKGVGTGDAWLELAEIGEEDAEGFSWISVAVGVGPTRLGLELVFRRGLQDHAETAIADDKAAAPLLKLGMVRDEAGSRIFFPIAIAAETLAQGFAMNDLDKAMLPVGQATKKAIGAKTDLDQLVNRVRAAGARK